MNRFSSLAFVALVACAGKPSLVAPDATSSPAANPALAKVLAPAHTAFGLDLWKKLGAQNPGNLAISPASLALAFGMTYAGARGATADEMRQVLHLDGIDDPHTAGGALGALWNAPNKAYSLAVANRLFGETTAKFEDAFLALTSAKYQAPLEVVDFVNAFEPARLHINGWVAKQTQDKIQDLLPKDSLDTLTRLVLVNAIYFKGTWKYTFDKTRTADAPFKTATGEKRVPFMAAAGRYDYGEAAGAEVLQLPYVGEDLVMTFVLPQGELAALESSLSPAVLDAWFASVSPTNALTVMLPRFRVATGSMSLKAHLEALGMKLAFSNGADLTAMSPLDLKVTDAFHKVFVEVNEEGTEAAAATAVVVGEKSASEPKRFVADRPFLFFVRDLRTGHILFMGRVADPS